MKTQNDNTLYEKVAKNIGELIQNRTLLPGHRIPSVRQMSQKKRVSMTTILEAYRLLERQGLIEARPQSGYYVKIHHEHNLPLPVNTALKPVVKDIKILETIASIYITANTSELVPLGASVSDSSLWPTDKLNRLLSAKLRRMGSKSIEYDFPPGNIQLRRQIAQLSLNWGCSLGPDEFTVTCGCVEAINLALRAVTRPGDLVAVESPTYYGNLHILESLGLRVLEIPASVGEGMDVDALEIALKSNPVKACLVIGNYQNPLGSVMPDVKKEKLVKILAGKNIPLIEDDVNGDLHFGLERPRALKSFDTKGNVLLCSSFSKTLAPGYRVGFISAGKHQEKVNKLKFLNTVGTPTLPQIAVSEFLASGSFDRYLKNLRAVIRERVGNFSQYILEYFPPGTKISRPNGGLVLWVELPKEIDSEEMRQNAYKKRISILPGTIFSATHTHRNYIRISATHAWNETARGAVATLGEIAKSYL